MHPSTSVVVPVMVEAWCLCAGCAVSELGALKKSASPIEVGVKKCDSLPGPMSVRRARFWGSTGEHKLSANASPTKARSEIVSVRLCPIIPGLYLQRKRTNLAGLLPEKYKLSPSPVLRPLLLLFSLHPQTIITIQYHQSPRLRRSSRCSKSPPSPVIPKSSVKITSQDLNASIPTQSRSAHLSVDLNSSPALNSFSSSSLTTANISFQDFPVFTTDPQSPWLPSTNSSLPAQSAQQLQSPESPQQDFVLFDQPQPPNRSTTSLQSQRRHSSHLHNRHQQPVSPAAQNQRVAQLLQAFGHSSSPVNRPTNQFYASSAPSSSTALNKQNRPARPPVPLFSQSTGSVPQQTAKMMNAAGLCTLYLTFRTIRSPVSDVELPEEFTAFDGGANTAFSSPAVPSVFDFGGSSSSSIGNLATISPQDLFAHDNFMSAPNSSALTALTSPSIYNESPEFDGYDVSPNFGSADFDSAADPWFPLFPQENNVTPAQPNSVENSPELKSDEVDSDNQSPAPSRRKSGTSPSTRHSSVAGVNARKRDKPLPPIVIEDPSDIVAMKRARNTLAARKSRERKAAKLEELEDKIAKLEAERDHWKRIALAQTGMQ
ncbi:Cross-pathway control 1 [Fusarium sp. NRRL 52700]|nr:Cross-pathway control 1 [Fusarium sp. NRRL 52700]